MPRRQVVRSNSCGCVDYPVKNKRYPRGGALFHVRRCVRIRPLRTMRSVHSDTMTQTILTLLLALACCAWPAANAQRMYDSTGRNLGRIDGERIYSASGQHIGRLEGERVYDSAGRLLGRIDGDRVYSASGSLMGRFEGERLYDASGRLLGRIDGERLYDASGRSIGRAEGLRRMQTIVYFYFFM